MCPDFLYKTLQYCLLQREHRNNTRAVYNIPLVHCTSSLFSNVLTGGQWLYLAPLFAVCLQITTNVYPFCLHPFWVGEFLWCIRADALRWTWFITRQGNKYGFSEFLKKQCFWINNFNIFEDHYIVKPSDSTRGGITARNLNPGTYIIWMWSFPSTKLLCLQFPDRDY